MIKDTNVMPSCFESIRMECRILRLCMQNGEQYGWGALQRDVPNMGVHLNVYRWSPAVLKQMKLDFEAVIVPMAKEMGAKTMYAVNKDYLDARWPKLIRHFGFPKPEIMALSSRKV